MDGPDAPRRHHESDDPFLLTLTEEERLHGLDLFGDEPSQAERPQIAESQVYERVPAYVDSVVRPQQGLERATAALPPAVRRAPPVPPQTWSLQVWQTPVLAAALAAVVVAYAVITDRVMRTPAGGRIATVAVLPSPAPAKPSAGISPSNKVKEAVEAVVISESAALPAPARSTPPISSKRQAPRVRPDRPIQTASVPRPGTAKPVRILESRTAPPPASPPPLASLPAEPRPVVAGPATLPPAEASAAPAPRMPAPPETAIQTVLSRYRTAYRDLDAGAARAVWPSVDTKALRKAFDSLEQQDVIFDSCQITVSDVRAVASCNGYAWYVPRVGNKGPHDDQRQWEFKLSKVDEVWLIDTVSAR